MYSANDTFFPSTDGGVLFDFDLWKLRRTQQESPPTTIAAVITLEIMVEAPQEGPVVPDAALVGPS